MSYFKPMKVMRGCKQAPADWGPTALTVGNFDGMHRGHQALVSQVVQWAREEKIQGGLMTFDPHPASVLFPERPHAALFNLSDRIDRACQLGLDFFVVETFDRALAQMSPEDFFNGLLVAKLKIKKIVVGHDFSFGKDRAGTPEVLKGLCEKTGVELKVMEAVCVNGETVSSSQIRKLVASGDVEGAHAFLGRAYYLQGRIVEGARRGRALGFPTANLKVAGGVIPKPGIYVSRFFVGGKFHKSVTSVGTNPTFVDDKEIKIETFILNFNGDIYGRDVRLEFYKFLRPETKFDGVDNLVKAIKQDVAAAAAFFQSDERGTL